MLNKVKSVRAGAALALCAGVLSSCSANGADNTTTTSTANTATVQASSSSTSSASANTNASAASTTSSSVTVSSADNPTVGQSQGAGAPDIATTDHDVMNDLQAAWDTGAIPHSNAPDVVGAFRFVCRHTNLAFDDPTVFPGQPGASHLHDQTGVTGWNASSNYGNLRTGGGGSGCNDVAGHDRNQGEATWAANRTPYWQPALLDGKGNAIVIDFTSFYYKRRPVTDPIVSDATNPHYEGKAVPLPNGIKFVFGGGDPTLVNGIGAFFKCVNVISGNGYSTDGTFAGAIACVKAHSDSSLEVQITAPDCWDGVHLDSADHRSHLAYGSYGDWGYYKCDAAHPYVIPTFTYAAFYTILPSDDGDIHFSSDEMDNSKPRGWSFHVDYGPAAWDPQVKAMWEDNCINLLLSCSGGDLGNGKMLKGANEPIYYDPATGTYTPSWRNPTHLVPIPAKSAS